MIQLISTRDINAVGHRYTDVLLAGLAPDGGLYVPSEYPQISFETLRALQGKSYQEVAFAIKKALIGGAIDDVDVRVLIERAYAPHVFEGTEDGNVVPLQKITGHFYVQNLSLGPTAAFKDMALQQLGQEMQYELNRRNEILTILGATSGDTGSAAEAAVRGLTRIKLFMLSPEQGMTSFQKAQMGMLTGDNIFNVSVRGRFDDCQDLVKQLKGEPEFSHLGAVNSINWGRVSSQVPYYFSAYLQAVAHIGDPIDVVVPSGNFGNVLSGYVAKRMGLPIRKLIVATNENNVLDVLFKTGVYTVTPAQVTSSPSMDISKASNYERLVFDLFDHDAGRTRAYMNEFVQKGTVDMASYGKSVTDLAAFGFLSGSSTHANRLATIKSTYDASGIVIDPHTADGVTIGMRVFDAAEKIPMIAMGTALPVKFENTIREALGFVPPRPKRFEGIEQKMRDDSFFVIDNDAEQLRAYVRAHG